MGILSSGWEEGGKAMYVPEASNQGNSRLGSWCLVRARVPLRFCSSRSAAQVLKLQNQQAGAPLVPSPQRLSFLPSAFSSQVGLQSLPV